MIYSLLPLQYNNIFLLLLIPCNLGGNWHMQRTKEMLFNPICQIYLPRICVIILNVGSPVVYPPVAFLMSILFTFAWFPCTTYPEWVSFLILGRFPHNATYPENICRIEICRFSFFRFSFSSLFFLWVTSSVDVSKCDWLDTVDKLKSGSCLFEW